MGGQKPELWPVQNRARTTILWLASGYKEGVYPL